MRTIKFRGVDTDDANRGDVIVFTLEELLATSDDISRFGSYCLATFRHYGGIIDGAYTLEETRHV